MIFKQLRQFHRIARKHPIAGKRLLETYGRFLSWQIASRLMPHVSMAMDWRYGLRLWLHRSLSAATAQWYFGLSEYEEMNFVLDFLKKDDLFVDVGANVGTFSLLAAGIAEAQTIAIEPSGNAFEWLEKNKQLNNLDDRIETHRVALGSQSGSALLSFESGQQNHILATNETATHEGILIKTLDEILRGRRPILLKIDVEGYEQAVLEGATETLQNPDLQAIIIETMGHSARYGFSETKVDQILRGYGFTPHSYLPDARTMKSLPTFTNHNTIYIRENSFEKKRLELVLPF
jgi:FkbM family methyltransferase